MCSDATPADHTHPGPPASAWDDLDPATTFRLEPVDEVTITTLMDNTADMLLTDTGPARRPVMGLGPTVEAPTMVGGHAPDALIAEHGYSVLVTVRRGAQRRSILFDTGTSPDGVVTNMRRLGVHPGSIEAIVCSHGHFDHTTGLGGLARVLGPANLPVLIHPHFWRQRRVAIPGREPIELPTTSRRALGDAGFEVVEDPAPSFLLDGSVLITGEVARTSGYEPGFPPQQAWLEGRWQPDPLVLDDQALVVDVAGLGLVVVTGCGHAGVVNICRWARRLTGERPLHAVVGGFHLGGPLFEPLIPTVIADLQDLAPSVVVPGHCTGWRAQHAIAVAMPAAWVPGSVGTCLVISA